MAKKTSRFDNGDLVVLKNSVYGLPKNMVARVSHNEKNRRGEIEVDIDGTTHVLIKTKYLDFVKSGRFSSRFNNGDNAKVIRHYERFIKNSIVQILSNYLGTNNKIIVQDERRITGGVPESILIKVV